MSPYGPLSRAAAGALGPLTDALADRRACERLLRQLGRTVTVSEATLEEVRELLPVLGLLQALDANADLPTLLSATSQVVAAIKALATLDPADLEGLPGSLATPEAWADLSAALPDLLLGRWLANNLPALHAVLRLTGVCVAQYAGRTPRDRFRWDALGTALGDPAGAVKEAIGWEGTFAAWPLQHELGLALARLGLPVRVRHRQRAVAEALAGKTVEAPSGLESDILLFSGATPTGDLAEIGLVFACSMDRGGTLYAGNLAYGELSAALPLSDTWSVQATGRLDGTATIGVRIQPSGLALVGGEAALGASIALDGRPPVPWILVGEAGGTRVELDAARLEVGVSGSTADPEAYALVRVDEGAFRFVLDLGAADSFLRGVIGEMAFAITAGGELRWDTSTGLSFSGGLGLEVTLPIDKDAGPLHVDSLTLALGAGDTGARLAVTTVAGLAIGPFMGTVGGIGAALELSPDPGGDGLAGLAAQLLFIPPTRVDLAITSEAVNGGGFVVHDPETGRYAGGLALEVFGFGLSAIVIVDTEIPGDPDGWALFGSLGLEFLSPIPLGFGFTLIGVGGLLALNRTMDIDGLASGLRTGAADSILFPDDLEADADAVLAGLDLWFPVQDSTTVIGPVIQIGWGSPTLITAELGVVVALPDLVIALLGSVEVLLPTQEDPLLTLRMDILGAVDLPASTVIVTASLYDSNLLGVFELSGDMGFYACLSGQPLFVLSIGGYHPQFDPPGALPAWLLDLRRVRAAVPLGDNVEVVLTSYVAVTSNTFQFGGRYRIEASLKVALTTYTAEGWFGVNVLLVLKPFRIVTRATAGVSISAGDRELLGVQLSARVEGPQPWYATGRASFTFFGLDVDFGFDVGSRPGGEPREIHPVAADVITAMSPPAGWEAAEPGDSWARGVVMVDQLPVGLWVRPDQAVDVRQSVAPLNRTITAYGEFVPAADRIDATSVTLGAESVASPEWLDDWFAPAQFDRLGDTARLSSPSYELMTAGVRFGDDGIEISSYPDTECTTVSRAPEESIFPDHVPDQVPIVSVYVSPVRLLAAPRTTRTVVGERITVQPTTYTVVRTSDGRQAEVVLTEAGLGISMPYASAVGVVTGRTAAERSRLRVAPSHAAVEAVLA